MTVVYIISFLSGLTIVLGFIALLKQKTYIDSQTNTVTDVEVPILGKLKTNYPALVFLVLGIFLAYITLDKYLDYEKEKPPPASVPWKITGALKTKGAPINWQNGELSCVHSNFYPKIDEKGVYTITAYIEKGKSFEDVIEEIDYTNGPFNIKINPKDEYAKYDKKQQSLLVNVTNTTRTYSCAYLKNILED